MNLVEGQRQFPDAVQKHFGIPSEPFGAPRFRAGYRSPEHAATRTIVPFPLSREVPLRCYDVATGDGQR